MLRTLRLQPRLFPPLPEASENNRELPHALTLLPLASSFSPKIQKLV